MGFGLCLKLVELIILMIETLLNFDYRDVSLWVQALYDLYLSTIAECAEYKKMIEQVFEKYYYDNYEGIITADCGSKAPQAIKSFSR